MKTLAHIKKRPLSKHRMRRRKCFISYAEKMDPRLQLLHGGFAFIWRSANTTTLRERFVRAILKDERVLPRDERSTTMKIAVNLGIIIVLIISFSLPASAQSHAGAGAAASSLSFSGGGGGYGGGGVSSHALPLPPEAHYPLAYAQGSATEYVASTYLPFEEAVKLGKEALAYKPKSIAQVAAECRAAKKPAQ
jgi:hypothetical protein